jgi:hypothetical protein
MSETMGSMGYLLLTLDTELAWGCFDHYRSEMFSADGSVERRSIEVILELLDEFSVVATWAVVGHLFYERCEACDICPILLWKGKYQSFHQIFNTAKPLWYGADIIKALLARRTRHEIAFHGYTHELFDENTMTEERARLEIQEWLRVSKREGIVPRTVVFPRDKIGHLSVFREAGFICYRGHEDTPRLHRLIYAGKLIKTIDHVLSLSTPPVYRLSGAESCGLVNFRSSQHFFGFNRRLELVLDWLNLHNLRINRMIKGVKKAADEKKLIHIWAHPWQFRTRKDFEKLRYLLGYVSEEVSRGRLRSIGMATLAEEALGRHVGTTASDVKE